MPSTLVFPPGFRVTNSNNRTVSGGEIRFFEAGTSTPKVVYSDSGLTQSLGSIVYTGSGGFPVANQGSSSVVSVYTGSDPYKLAIHESNGTLAWSADNVIGAPTLTPEAQEAPFIPVITSGSDHTFEAADRFGLFNYQSNTATFPSAVTLGDGWNVHIRNGGSSGRVTLSAASGIAYQGTSYTTLYLEPGQALSVACDGSSFRAYSDAVLYTPPGFRPNTPGIIMIADRITAEPSTSVGIRYIVSSSFGTFTTHDIVTEVASGVFVGTTPPTDCGWVAYVQDEDRYYSFIGSAWVLGLEPDASDTVKGLIELAVQSEMETATDTARAVTPGRQRFHPGHPKAGGNFNGTGTPAFRSGDYGMGAITDNGTGNYGLALDTAFSDTNFWATTSVRADSSQRCNALHLSGSKTASLITVQAALGDDSDQPFDPTEGGITLWGDYA